VPVFSIDKLTDEARRLALEYREATGKTLPITGEIAMNDAIRLLNLKPNETSEPGFDAVLSLNGKDIRVHVKGRAIFKPKGGYRLGHLNMEQSWDAILLVVMNDKFETEEIYLCNRDELESFLGDTTANRRGTISVARFRNIGTLLWSLVNGLEDNGYWSNN